MRRSGTAFADLAQRSESRGPERAATAGSTRARRGRLGIPPCLACPQDRQQVGAGVASRPPQPHPQPPRAGTSRSRTRPICRQASTTSSRSACSPAAASCNAHASCRTPPGRARGPPADLPRHIAMCTHSAARPPRRARGPSSALPRNNPMRDSAARPSGRARGPPTALPLQVSMSVHLPHGLQDELAVRLQLCRCQLQCAPILPHGLLRLAPPWY